MIDMKRVILISSLLLTISFIAVAQIFGATHGGEQKAFGATAPSATFQSTSSMSGSGSSYSATPSLNADGTAAYEGASYTPAKSIRRPGVIRKEPGNPFADNPTTPDNTPLGDAVLPLLLMSLTFCGYLYLRRKRSEA